MADKILTFNGKTISGPNGGGGMVVLRVPDPPSHIVTIGGRTYRTVIIGNQEWMAENLDWKFDGCDIGSSGLPSTPAAWYYDNDEATYGIDGTRKCGLMYNWYAVKYLDDNKASLLPDGWHVPTTSEWDTLATAVGGTSTAGTKLKASSVSWASSWGGTDDYGFAALPSGYRNANSSFLNVGTMTNFWTTSEESSSKAYFSSFSTRSSMDSHNYSKTSASYIRLMKDAT